MYWELERYKVKIMYRLMKISCLIATLTTSAAYAIPIQHTYNFTASGFGAGSPESVITGSITATFDQAIIGNGMSGMVDAISLVADSHIFTVAETIFSGFGSGGIMFGGAHCGASGMCGLTPDFWLGFDSNNMLNGFSTFSFASTSTQNFYYATSLKVVEGSMNVPEPVSLSLFGLGLVGLVVARRRKGEGQA